MPADRDSKVAAAGLAALNALRAENRAAAARLRACFELHALCEEEQFARDVEAGYYDPDGPDRPRDHAVVDPLDIACAELVAVYGVHHHRASALLKLARTLVTRFPAIIEAMEEGLMDEKTAELLVRQMRTVDCLDLDAVHRLVVKWLLDSIKNGVRPGRNAILSQTDKIIAAYDPDGVLARRAAAVRERKVFLRRGVDGMTDLHAHLTSTEAAAIHAALDRTAEERLARDKQARIEAIRSRFDVDADEAFELPCRSRDEHRADALVDAFLGTGDQSESGGEGLAPQTRPTITVLAPRGLGDEPEVYLPRGGPASIDALISLLARSVGATISVPQTSPGSADPTTGARRYRISAELARRVRLRDGTCRHPGCSVSAEHCDVDHAEPFNHSDPGRGGLTIEANLMCLCRRHHRFKTFHTQWRYQLARDGTLTVTTDSGHTLTTRPDGPLERWRQRTGESPDDTPVPGPDQRPWLSPRPRGTHWYRRARQIAAQRLANNAAAAQGDMPDDVPDDYDPPPF